MQAPPLPDSLKESVEGSKVEYVNLGKSGLRVSVPILGAMSIGDPAWAPWVAGEEEVRSYPATHLPNIQSIDCYINLRVSHHSYQAHPTLQSKQC